MPRSRFQFLKPANPHSGADTVPELLRLNEPVIDRFLDSLWAERGIAPATAQAYRQDLLDLLRKTASPLLELNRARLLDFLAGRMRSGASVNSIVRQLSSLRQFYAWAQRERLLHKNPMIDLDGPRRLPSLPGSLSMSQVEALLAAPAGDAPLELRDRAMLEVLYASGMRVSELAGLVLARVHLGQGVVRILGKGGRERLVPLGEAAVDATEQWLSQRPSFKPQGEWLLVSRSGRQLSRQAIWARIKKWALAAGISEPVYPHRLRHSFATHLLDNGADLRVVQMLLGHADLATTQIYTQVTRARLKSLHEKHHPRG